MRMNHFLSYIEQAKGHPHHVRKQIAFILAGVGATFVATTWLWVSVATGSFAITDPLAPRGGLATVNNESSGGQLAGALATFPQEPENISRIQIVDAVPALSPVKESEQTFIPF